ncbi:hypothetical protein [Leptolyngbya sp. 7M]|uniref:hypothetical protein n=1 Tax=Leptolyngbya sp. 7M TaxID=2812896 RepID=UPI001B8D1C3A|nr:hypothetical protein [Leptolyngbya sp. 7M]QYO65286.1 hypothetical protein JVX88_00430 [Leptolyngbya sp. 7M]
MYTTQPEIYEIPEDHNATSLKEIAEKLTGKEHAVFKIELSRTYSAKIADSWQGVELLLWIRVLGMLNHVLLVTNADLGSILRLNRRRNSIIQCKGSTVQMNGKSTALDLSERADPMELKEYFKGFVDLTNIKHTSANRFGLERLQQLHRNNDRSYTPLQKFAPDVEYEAFKQAYSIDPISSLNNLGDAPKLLQRLRTVVEDKRPKIIMVDDMAEMGWSHIFHGILGPGCDFHSIGKQDISNNSSPQALATIIRSKGLDIKEPHLLILDLRLLSDEENENLERPMDDYKELLSFKTLQALNLRKNDDLRLRVMFSTASKDASKLSALKKDRTYAPHGIFIKEGIESQLSAHKSLSLYCDMLKMLREIIYKMSATSLINDGELLHPDIEQHRRELVTKLSGQWNGVKKSREHGSLRWHQDICLDTNVFLAEDESESLVHLLKNSSSRLRVPRTVLYELQKIADDKSQTYGSNDVLASFFIDRIDELQIEITEEGMSDNQRNVIATNQHHPPHFADGQIKTIMLENVGQRLLFTKDNTLRREILAASPNAKIQFNVPRVTVASKRPSSSGGSNHKLNKPAPVRSFEVRDVKLSKTGKSFNFIDREGEHPALILQKSAFPTEITVEELKRLIGRSIATNNTARELLGIVNQLSK